MHSLELLYETYCCTLQASNVRIARRKFLFDAATTLSANQPGTFTSSLAAIYCKTLVICAAHEFLKIQYVDS